MSAPPSLPVCFPRYCAHKEILWKILKKKTHKGKSKFRKKIFKNQKFWFFKKKSKNLEKIKKYLVFSKFFIEKNRKKKSSEKIFFEKLFKKFTQRKVLYLLSFCERGILFLLTFPESPCSTTIQTMILLCWESICATIIALSLYEIPKHHSTLLILTKPSLSEKKNMLPYS